MTEFGIKTIVKRDGRIVEFDSEKITRAIMKAVVQVGGDSTDRSIAENLTGMVVYELERKGNTQVQVDEVQDLVEKTLIEKGHAKTAKEYILYRSDRDRVRNMNSQLMREIEKLTFSSSTDVELKRENANIDGDTAMGTMLRYGSETAKMFNLNNLVSPEYARAHRVGDIHIHDLDFLALTETCVSNDTMLTIKNKHNKILNVTADSFDCLLEGHPVDTVVDVDGMQIVSKGRFVDIKNCVRHGSSTKQMLEISTNTGSMRVTSEHVVPVLRNKKEIEVRAKEILIGDRLVADGVCFETNTDVYKLNGLDCSKIHDKLNKTVKESESKSTLITGIREIEYSGYVYDFETENHYFSANGFTVHNCCQIDIDKLFKNGFSTGHGFLREPGEIRSYAALACITIQSCQNDMHSVA